ncbi:MAG: glycosyltransferase family 4 protein [Gammaproteobacteria bacterium]
MARYVGEQHVRGHSEKFFPWNFSQRETKNGMFAFLHYSKELLLCDQGLFVSLPLGELLNLGRTDIVPRRKIAWLVDGREGYGVASSTLCMLAELRRRGWETAIISLGNGPFVSRCEAQGHTVLVLNVGEVRVLRGGLFHRTLDFISNTRSFNTASKAVIAALREIHPQALHVDIPSLIGLAGRAAKAVVCPVFWLMPNCISDSYPLGVNRWIYQWVCWKYRIKVMANSHFTARTLGSFPLMAEVMHLGVDIARFDPKTVKAIDRVELGIPLDAIVFGVVASLSSIKGQDRVLDAILHLGYTQPPLHLLLVGEASDSEYARNLVRKAEAARAAHRLHMVGFASSPERYYSVIDVAINSRINPEPFGLSVVEAMAMERPVLVHASGGPAETVIDGETGWHFHDISVHGIASALKRVLQDRNRWCDMGHNARLHVMNGFTATKEVDRYLNIIGPRILGKQSG